MRDPFLNTLRMALIPTLSVVVAACDDPPLAFWPPSDAGVDDDAAPNDDDTPVGDGTLLAVRAACPDGWCWERPADPGLNLIAIDGTAKNDVWAGGEAGFLTHFDGSTWTHFSIDGMNITNVHAFDVDDVIVTGTRPQGGRTSVRIMGGRVRPFTIDGGAAHETFGTPSTGLFAIADAGVYGVDASGSTLLLPLERHIAKRGFARAADDVFVGYGGTALWHMSGTTWSQVWPIDGAPAGARAPLIGTRALDGSLFFAGDSDDDEPAYIARLVDDTWTFWPDVPSLVRSISAESASEAIVVHPLGVLSLVDDSWSTAHEGEANAAALLRDGQAFAAGRGGTVLHRGTDGTWSPLLGSAHRALITDVRGTDDGALFVGDYRHGLWDRSDDGWTRSDGAGSFFALAGDGETGVYAVSGPSPGVWHHSDGVWGPLVPPPTYTNDVHVTSWGEVVTGGGCALYALDEETSWHSLELDDEVFEFGESTPCASWVSALFDDGDGALFMLTGSPFGNALYRRSDDVWTRVLDESPAGDGVSLEHATHDGARLLVVDSRGRVFADDGAGFVDMGAPEPLPFAMVSYVGPAFTVRAFSMERFFVAGRAAHLVERHEDRWIRHAPPIGDKQITAVWLDDDGALTLVGADGMIVRKALD